MSIPDNNYFYIIQNNDWNHINAIKYGVTDDPISRISKCDQHPEKNEYLYLFKYNKMTDYSQKGRFEKPDTIISTICRNIERRERWIRKFNLTYIDKLSEFIINKNGGREFINRLGLDYLRLFILEDFPKLGLEITEINLEEVEKINQDSTKTNDYLTDCYDSDNDIDNDHQDDKIILRDYQDVICKYIIDKFKNGNNRIFLELATGAGKTIIAKFIMNELKSEYKKIIIFSPRIDIKEQNKDKIKINGIEVSCYCIQSYMKAFNEINKNKDSDYFIWFDEAHWALEDWCINTTNKTKSFLLNNNDSNIKYRLFTSASPNKDVIIENKATFGELYSPIKMKDLMEPDNKDSIKAEKKYLVNIKCDIFDFEKSKNQMTNESYVNFMINTFLNKNKTLGFSFHTCCNNAFQLYKIHLKIYNDKNKICDIPKPYLLISETKEGVQFNDIKAFEGETMAIAYVVGKFTMGYDNDRIDILFFSDSKNSYKDNNQAIGRGTRLRKDETYKVLNVIIPTNHNNDIEKDYANLKGTLEYLIKDIELSIDNISLNTINYNKDEFKLKRFINKDNDDNKDFNNSNDDINSKIGTIIYDIFKKEFIWTEKKFIIQLMRNNIHNNNDYINYYNKNKIGNLPEPQEIFKQMPKFNYYNTFRFGECPFINKNEYLNEIECHLEDLLMLNDDNEKIQLLTSKNPKIPAELPWLFYGGKRNEYFND